MSSEISRRTRQLPYYLDRINSRIVLCPDGSVGELGDTTITVTEQLPTRVEGRTRERTSTGHMLGVVATYASPAEYLAAKYVEVPNYLPYGPDTSWELDDFPQEVRAEYEAWLQTSEPVPIDDIRRTAATMQADAETRETRQVSYADYPETTTTYADRSVPRAQPIYYYPMIDVIDEGERKLVPLDIAGVIAADPGAVTYRHEMFADYAGERLVGEVWLDFDTSHIARRYIDPTAEGYAPVHNSDRLASKISLLVNRWIESGTVPHYYQKVTPVTKAAEVITILQQKAFLAALEYDAPKDYDTQYKQLISNLGKAGYALTYEFSNGGMGERDTMYYASVMNEQGVIVYDRLLAMGVDSRDAVGVALERCQPAS